MSCWITPCSSVHPSEPVRRWCPAEFLVAVVGWVSAWTDERDAELVGIERASKPTGRRADGSIGPIEPGALIGLGMVAGAVLAYFPDAIVVPQAGSSPLYAYPKDLVGPRETTGTGGRLRHARSAWDVAGGAPGMARRLRALRS